VPDAKDYKIVLNTDAREFAGPGFIMPNTVYPIQKVPAGERKQSVQVYLPSRTAQVLRPV
jgi:1,4-alpha-glucan branching enzyme